MKDPGQQFEGNPEFYHNLMFYFTAMPFVLADDGIEYGEADTLEFEGKGYPGIRISYGSGVGASPKDEYYLHYDPDTYRMAWLGYTVTYFSGTPSENIHWIRYEKWQEAGGVLLPESISWYNHEGRAMKDVRDTVIIDELSLNTAPKETGFYQPPEEAVVVGDDTRVNQ